MYQKIGWVIFLSICLFFGCKTPKTVPVNMDQSYRIGFYNVENLFDTIDHPVKFDEDFTPSGKQVWNTERYTKKLKDLDQVINGMGYPILLGVSEIENEAVLKDLAATGGMANKNYGIVHFESPDKRGIDCGLFYQKDYFKVQATDKIRIEFPEEMEAGYTSRDIIYTNGLLFGKYDLHVFVNHWPSRRGGLEKSEPKRVLVAQHLRDAVDEIFAKDPNANILIMGDFNDEPANNSVLKTLAAQSSLDNPKSGMLYNWMAAMDAEEKGSYNFRGDWNMLDQIITSAHLVDQKSKLIVSNPTIFQEPWMMFEHPKNGLTPNRTYGGPNYYGGYSDHLPVYVEISVRK